MKTPTLDLSKIRGVKKSMPHCITHDCSGVPVLTTKKYKHSTGKFIYDGEWLTYECPICHADFTTTQSDTYSLNHLPKKKL